MVDLLKRQWAWRSASRLKLPLPLTHWSRILFEVSHLNFYPSTWFHEFFFTENINFKLEIFSKKFVKPHGDKNLNATTKTILPQCVSSLSTIAGHKNCWVRQIIYVPFLYGFQITGKQSRTSMKWHDIIDLNATIFQFRVNVK